MGNKVNERVIFTNIIESNSEHKKEKQFLEEAQEALQDFDSCFMLKKPPCEELPGNTIICHEMDLFELYMCVVVKELKHGGNIDGVKWVPLTISGKTVAYPHIEEIWNAIEKEYAKETCSKKFTDCVFSRRVRRCGVKPQDKIENTSVEADLIFCINREEARENKYDDLIALLCIYSKELYDRADENMSMEGLLSGVKETVNEILNDYYNQEMKSNVVKEMYDEAMKRRRKYSEKLLYSGENSCIDENCPSTVMFWDRITVCSQWKD